jgi:RNA polymerase sigma-70 factor (ECF subfamily)
LAEQELELKQIRELDPQAISAVHERYFGEIYRYAYLRTGDNSVAEDVTSEVFVRMLEALHRGKGPNENVRGWLYGTAANLIHDHFREMYKKPVETMPEEIEADGVDPERSVEKKMNFESVLDATHELTEEQQRVLALRFGSGLSVEETAGLMKKKGNAIKALQFRALHALRRNLGEDHS